MSEMPDGSVVIRQETRKDHHAVFQLVEKVFIDEIHSDHKEQYLIERLRKSDSFIPELSIVAMIDSKLIGYVLLTKAEIKSKKRRHTTLVLAPVAVDKAFQKKGIGARLMGFAHEKASQMGYGSVVIIGHENYYPKFGYQKASEFGVRFPFKVPDENGFVIELRKGELTGVEGELEYPKEFFET